MSCDQVGHDIDLYICEKICHSLGGRMCIESNERHGTIFNFMIEAQDTTSAIQHLERNLLRSQALVAQNNDLI